MTTANKITIARIVMIPVFVMMAVYYGKSVQRGHPHDWQRFTAIFVFLLAAASDWVDGYIARHYNQRSRLGVVLDPIADKGLLLAAIITLSFSNWTHEFPVWFPVLVITRDAVIVIGAAVMHHLNGTFAVKPSWMGKAATATQMLAIACYLLQLDFFKTTFMIFDSTISIDFLYIPVALAGFFTLISGIGYVTHGIVQLQAGGHGDAKF